VVERAASGVLGPVGNGLLSAFAKAIHRVVPPGRVEDVIGRSAMRRRPSPRRVEPKPVTGEVEGQGCISTWLCTEKPPPFRLQSGPVAAADGETPGGAHRTPGLPAAWTHSTRVGKALCPQKRRGLAPHLKKSAWDDPRRHASGGVSWHAMEGGRAGGYHPPNDTGGAWWCAYATEGRTTAFMGPLHTSRDRSPHGTADTDLKGSTLWRSHVPRTARSPCPVRCLTTPRPGPRRRVNALPAAATHWSELGASTIDQLSPAPRSSTTSATAERTSCSYNGHHLEHTQHPSAPVPSGTTPAKARRHPHSPATPAKAQLQHKQTAHGSKSPEIPSSPPADTEMLRNWRLRRPRPLLQNKPTLAGLAGSQPTARRRTGRPGQFTPAKPMPRPQTTSLYSHNFRGDASTSGVCSFGHVEVQGTWPGPGGMSIPRVLQLAGRWARSTRRLHQRAVKARDPGSPAQHKGLPLCRPSGTRGLRRAASEPPVGGWYGRWLPVEGNHLPIKAPRRDRPASCGSGRCAAVRACLRYPLATNHTGRSPSPPEVTRAVDQAPHPLVAAPGMLPDNGGGTGRSGPAEVSP